MVTCGKDTFLPRPFSVHRRKADSIAIFYAVLPTGRGTNWLSELGKNDQVKLFGPLGRGFSVEAASRRLLLVAGGHGIAPLYSLAESIEEAGRTGTLLYGTPNQQRYSLPPELSVVATTEDGSVGEKGLVTSLIPRYASEGDQVFACGPTMMYKAMAQMPELRGKPVQVSLETVMGCGRGVCYSCTIKTRHGLRQVCQDGPIFDLDDVLWGELGL